MSNNQFLLGNHFLVNWGGANMGFQEVSGLELETEVASYIDGSFPPDKAPVKKLGRTKYSETISLKTGYCKGDDEILQLFLAAKTDHSLKRDITITLLDETQTPVMVIQVREAIPIKIDSLALNASSSDIMIQTIDFSHEGYSIEYV
ncbi:MAG: phage tail protein [Bacteroidota bacterium]